jgi:hypothetical protein
MRLAWEAKYLIDEMVRRLRMLVKTAILCGTLSLNTQLVRNTKRFDSECHAQSLRHSPSQMDFFASRFFFYLFRKQGTFCISTRKFSRHVASEIVKMPASETVY